MWTQTQSNHVCVRVCDNVLLVDETNPQSYHDGLVSITRGDNGIIATKLVPILTLVYYVMQYPTARPSHVRETRLTVQYDSSSVTRFKIRRSS